MILRREEGRERIVDFLPARKAAVDSLNRCLMNGNYLWDFLIARGKAAIEELPKSYWVLG